VQSSGVAVKVIPFGGSESSGAGTVAYSADGVVLYTPTQAETNYTSFVLIAKKTGCLPASQTVITSESTVSGRVYVQTIATTQINAIADQVWDEVQSAHVTAGTMGKTLDLLRKANAVVEGTVLASPAPTATTFTVSGLAYPTGAFNKSVLWFANDASIAEQNSPIATFVNNGDGTQTITLQDPLTTAPTAGDGILIDPTSHVHTIAEIQSGLATLANQVVLIDGMGFVTSVLMGSISDAGTAAETYQITFAAATYTVDYSGLDATGNRGSTTRTKT
jgi:hypothetical protein